MKKRFIHHGVLGVILSLGILFSQSTFAQNVLQFTSVTATPENAIQLSWASNSNEVYEVDYADSLIDTNTGATTWMPLYTDYPSQGTNTFWLDTGDYYDFDYIIPHPKDSPMRFYRVVMTGTNTGSNPTVTITSPTNGATLSSNITVTVSASSDQVLSSVTLYVDGQAMWPSDDGSNFVINTCEWWNGPHTLFAVAKSMSHFEGAVNDTAVTYGRTASAYVNVTFNNLITEVAFSQPYFEPSLGQTQQITADFAANCNWTLQIQDDNSNTVCNGSGSGDSMVYNWDGTGNGETNLPDGIYTYLISAVTNGESSDVETGGSGGGGGGTPPSPDLVSSSFTGLDDSELWAAPTNSVADATPVPLALYPPGFDTNDLTIFSATPSEIDSLRPHHAWRSHHSHTASLVHMAGFSADDSGSGSGSPSGQSTRAPERPPTAKGKGTIGTFGVGYQTYNAPGGSFSTPPIVKETLGFANDYVQLDGETSGEAGNHESWGAVLENKDLANGFIAAMTQGRYSGTVIKGDGNFSTSDLTGGSFNGVNVALLLLHCSYATSSELDGIYHTYLRFYNGGTSYVKLDQCYFGGSGTNGLKWVGLLACSALRSQNYNSMYDSEVLPINNDLHLLCSVSTVATAAPTIGQLWAQKMLGAGTNAPETVEQSWFDAGSQGYIPETNHITITFRVAGWPSAFSDHLSDVSSSPGTGDPSDITKEDQTVFSNP